MKIIIKYITIIIFLFFINEANGQQDEINWGPELEGKGLVELIGEQGDYIYATQVGTGLLNLKINFLTIDKTTLQIIKKNMVKFSALTTIPIDFSIVDDKFQLLLVQKGKNFRKIIYDLDMNEISNELIRKFDKTAMSAESTQGTTLIFPTNIISSFRSADNSKVTVMVYKFGKKRGGIEFFTFDLKDNLNQIYTTELTGSSSGSKEMIEDVELRPDGSINLLIKRYIDGEKERKSKKPNYNYIIYKLELENQKIEIPLPNQSTFWKNAKLKTTDDGSMIVAAMTQFKPKDRPNGYQILKYSLNNDMLFNKSHDLNARNKNGKIEKTLYLRNIITHNNKDFVLLSEEASGVTYFSAPNIAPDDKFYSNNITLDAFNDEGAPKWSECIYRNVQEQSRRKLLTSSIVCQFVDKISIFFNTTEKNLKEYNSNNPKSEKLPNKKSATLMANISLNGDLTFKKLSSENKMHIVSIGSISSKDKIYFLGAKNNKMKKMYLGSFTK
ncbi:MAG: hypothetical protein ACI86M_002881 [Saprospiraceae bacterium]|jgi:hypothetical protein